jgi:hypothetical protein
MYGEIGSKSNTMIFADRPADINVLMAQAGAVLSASSKQQNLLDNPPSAGADGNKET